MVTMRLRTEGIFSVLLCNHYIERLTEANEKLQEWQRLRVFYSDNLSKKLNNTRSQTGWNILGLDRHHPL
jgi:hypothetical protein